jgi:hypothetical protein
MLPYFNSDNPKIIIFIHSIYDIFTSGYLSCWAEGLHGWYSDLAIGCTIYSSDPSRDKKFFCFIEHPEQFWGPPNLLLKEYQRLLPQG